MSVKFQLITPKDIIEAFEAHGNNFVVIDLEGRKKCPTVEYIKINFKLANNCIISPGLKVKEKHAVLQKAGFHPTIFLLNK